MIDLSSTSTELVIALGGIKGRLGFRDEVFGEVFSGLDKKKILIRDPQKAYFLKGLPGFGKNFSELADHFRQLILKENISHISVIGNCMGGYSAILLGILLEADVIHAFIPKTTLKWYHRIRFMDFKGKIRILKMVLAANFVSWDQQKFLDLKSFLRKSPNFQGQIHIYPKKNDRSSLIHAAHLQDSRQVTIHHEQVDKAGIIQSL